MLAINYTEMRGNFKDYCDKVTDDFETVIITRKDNKNVVMISQDEYNNLMENMFIMSNKKNYSRLLESRQQLEQGLSESRELLTEEDE
ncbi:type II toxin-antitoxin system prevent-host-death family antitoxin [Saccharibacillus sp. CPCC 101409]|uniref:type II toxin-antitoxin system Phd/YefM family antitoxin n=1 Tax=Saccharibacillus sp. CPCC 101409 TaxID=3058041 RepID=UPI002674103E|nr:type II toxin-antitoxin system prevent-host-death family antitoxin [Saccharibacillus sp. CPCC 101409]MDO3410133.1 type II toxin-antitoxin system prevent-host-death family antitoxin [Saccharibacillus sp. CPCC 101409]